MRFYAETNWMSSRTLLEQSVVVLFDVRFLIGGHRMIIIPDEQDEYCLSLSSVGVW